MCKKLELKQEEVTKKPLIELAKAVMADERKEMNFNDLFNRVADLKGLTEEQRKAKISQFYTDLNMDGHFTTTGANNWGLKNWYKSSRIKKSKVSHTLPKRYRRESDVFADDPNIDIDEEELHMLEEDGFDGFEGFEEDEAHDPEAEGIYEEER